MDFIRPKRPTLGMDMAPLIDCVFLLLIFFMLSSTFMSPALKLTLPTATTREKVDPEELVVSIDADGAVYVGGQAVAIEDLRQVLETRLATLERKQVNFRGDRGMRYELFVQVMDLAKQAGARQLNIVHQEPRPQ